MCLRNTTKLALHSKKVKAICTHGGIRYHAITLDGELLPSEWYRAAYAKLIRFTRVLRDVHQSDGNLVNISENSTILDDCIIGHIKEFKSIVRSFIGSHSMQHALQKKFGRPYFSDPTERNAITLNSLTKVCNLLNISAQQRKNIRLTVCPQVTQHHIWRGALEEVLINLKSDMDAFSCYSPSSQMGKQIVSSCFNYLVDANRLSNSTTPSWMRPTPVGKVETPLPSQKWEEVLEMFVDLTKCLAKEERLECHLPKLEAMKEGLYQIKDILVEKDISFKEVRRQDCLVQKKLTKSLGHSSKCLFTLLLYYLCGTVKDVELEVCGGMSRSKKGTRLYAGKILTSCDEGAVWNAVKQLSRALGVFKFVWETAAIKERLELEGHMWCIGVEERTMSYRGDKFFVHKIRL